MADLFQQYDVGVHGPARNAELAVHATATTVNFTNVSRGLWVGAAGNVAVVTAAAQTVTLKGVTAGSLIPIQAKRVNSTNTTVATGNIVALW